MNSPRRILLSVTGLTPQVVTETLYALACRDDNPWIPHEIHLITTAIGAENARLNLLAGEAWFKRLCTDYDLPEIRFTADCIHVLPGESGHGLDDIRTPEQNTLAADFIVETVRRLTDDPASELHVSIAGGRKTMGYYLGYALSLYGRAQDKLSHVLVSEPFESNRQFYFPTPYDHAIHVERGGKHIAHNARLARVELAEIPYVSLRHDLPEALLRGQASFRATVEAARAAIAPANLELDPARRILCAAGRSMRLPPAQFALLAIFAWRARHGRPALRAPLKDIADEEWSRERLAELRAACGAMHVPDSVEAALDKGVDGAYFSQHLSRLHAILRKEFGPASHAYLIDDSGTRPRRYRLNLPPHAIHIGGTSS